MAGHSFVTSDGRTLAYELKGPSADDAATTLVCHSGGPGMSATYFGDLGGLDADGVRLVVLDPRGTGGSSPPADGRNELEDYSDDIDELREQLGLERIDLLGHSHGGFVGMVHALRHPQGLRRLVLLCTAPRFSDELRAEAVAAVDAHRGQPWFEDAVAAQRARGAGQFATPEEAAALYAREMRLWFPPRPSAAVDAFLSEGIRGQRPNLEALSYFNTRLAPSYDMRPRLSEITAPTLVLNGADDFFGPRVSARELAAIPGSQVVVLDDAGHFPFVEQPQRVRAELRKFLLS
jgi:proline iminopeptidase